MFDYDRYGNAFVDRRLHKLRVLITEQSDEVFVERGITAPSACVSVILFLQDKGNGSIAQIAEALGYSHQLINHRLQQLEKAGFTTRFADPRDKRKWRIKLTTRGLREAERVEEALPLIARAFDDLFSDLDVDLTLKLKDLHSALSKQPIGNRIKAETQ